MDKTIVLTTNAPAPIGPYSQAVFAGNTLYMSGQIAIDPATGQYTPSDVENETKQVMANIEAVLKAAGLNWANVVKTTIFLQDMDDFGKVNAIYGNYFNDNPPARETVQVAKLPKGAKVEISVIAVK